jgi:uncharacterized membrane protein YoaK (UPF0700 family)
MKSDSDWRVQPLLGFWQAVNWDNRTLVTTVDNHQVVSSLSFSMSVREYFRAIAWTGIPAIAVTNTAAKAEARAELVDESKETLEDFLNDISSFF